MEYIYPNYYKEFSCIADRCEDTCCAGWGIVIDNATLTKYKSYEGPFGNRLNNSINFRDNSFLQSGHRCAFLDENNLCDIYSEAGPHMLCKTCRRYPRHYEEFENYRVVALSISCPEVARIILSKRDNIDFVTSIKDTKDEEYEYFDFFLFTKLQEIQELIIEKLQDRNESIESRLSIVLGIAHDVQKRIDDNRLFEVDELISKYKKPEFNKKAYTKFEKYKNTSEISVKVKRKLFRNLYKLEVLKSEWPSLLKECEELLYNVTPDEYRKNREQFELYYKDKIYEYEQIAVYFIFTYLLGAVYDETMYDKVRFAITNTLLIMELDMALWLKNDKKFSFENQVDIVHRFSREVEHSDPNLKKCEKMISKQKEYSMSNLLGCIWN